MCGDKRKNDISYSLLTFFPGAGGGAFFIAPGAGGGAFFLAADGAAGGPTNIYLYNKPTNKDFSKKKLDVKNKIVFVVFYSDDNIKVSVCIIFVLTFFSWCGWRCLLFSSVRCRWRRFLFSCRWRYRRTFLFRRRSWWYNFLNQRGFQIGCVFHRRCQRHSFNSFSFHKTVLWF